MSGQKNILGHKKSLSSTEFAIKGPILASIQTKINPRFNLHTKYLSYTTHHHEAGLEDVRARIWLLRFLSRLLRFLSMIRSNPFFKKTNTNDNFMFLCAYPRVYVVTYYSMDARSCVLKGPNFSEIHFWINNKIYFADNCCFFVYYDISDDMNRLNHVIFYTKTVTLDIPNMIKNLLGRSLLHS